MKAVAPWVRTRLRAAPGPTAATGLLVLVTAFLATAFPRAMDTYEGEGLRWEIRTAEADARTVGLTVGTPTEGTPAERVEGLSAERLAQRYRTVLQGMPQPLRPDREQSSYGARTVKPHPALDDWIPRLDGGATVFTASAQADLARNAKLRSGRLPAPTQTGPAARSVEAVVTSATAKILKIEAGSTVHLERKGNGAPLAVRVTGVVEPLRPDSGYWAYEPVLRAPVQLRTSGVPPLPYWHGALLLPPQAAPALLGLGPDSEAYWRIGTDPGGLTAGDRSALRSAVASVESGPALSALRDTVDPELAAQSGLDGVLIRYDDALKAIGPVVAVAAFGAATVMAVVLLMAGGLAAARRHSELTLLRSRGGSLTGIAGRLLAEVAVPALPAAAAGAALAWLLVPEGRALPALLAAGAVALTGCAALPLRAVALHRRARLHGERDDVVRARPTRRRTVVELTVLVLAVASAFALRQRGTGVDGGVDQLISAAPVLVSTAAALLLVRLYPLPLRLLALPLARARGLLGFLALARAGRSPPPRRCRCWRCWWR
ncbi:hypothetical protein [Streptomyces clavuligerus]|uniref:hypothetical protein n=1 Tax=Streptomyces clavuligerus TaxID=1901 RepID=UPI002F2B31D8